MAFFRSAGTIRRINFFLCAAAVAAAAVLLHALFGAGEAPAPRAPVEVSAGVPEPEERPLERYSVISGRNLFGLPSREPEPEPGARERVPEPEPMPGLKLRGTVLFSSGEGFAVIELPGGEGEETVRTGQSISGMELVSVGWDSAVLRGRPGELALAIDESARTASAVPAAAGRTGRRGGRTGEVFTVERSRFEEMARDPRQLLGEIQVRPNITERGTEGFVVSGIRPGSIADEFGLRDGDVITSVNRTALDGPENIMRVYNQVIESGRASVEVNRDGQRLNLTYRVQR